MDPFSTVSELVVTAGSNIRKPRWRVLVNDQHLPTFVGGQVAKNGNRVCDTFDLDFALFHSSTFTPAWWRKQLSISIKVEVADEAESDPQWETLIEGKVDHKDIQFGRGIVTVSGRDAMGRLADNSTYEAYPNKTAAEIARQIGGEEGFDLDVDDSEGNVGVLYKEDHEEVVLGKFSRKRKKLDLLNYLADREGYEMWVEGNTLHFKKPDENPTVRRVIYTPPESTDSGFAYQIEGANVIDLTLSHDLNKSKDIRVEVLSRHARKGKTNTAKAKRKQPPKLKTNADGGGDENVRVIRIIRPNLEPEEAQKLARSLQKRLTEREYEMTWEMPARWDWTCRDQVEFVGLEDVLFDPDAGTQEDQTFYIEEIRYSYSPTRGASMSVRAKNHPEIEDAQ